MNLLTSATRGDWGGATPAQERYEMRGDLGNVKPGDGERLMGRGLIQITGRANYAAVSRGFGLDYQRRPEGLERPPDAARASGWWWQNNGCNEIADTGDFLRLSIRVNGKNGDGLPNGWVDRQRRYKAAAAVLGWGIDNSVTQDLISGWGGWLAVIALVINNAWSSYKSQKIDKAAGSAHLDLVNRMSDQLKMSATPRRRRTSAQTALLKSARICTR